jgi:hypothetical protein
MSAPPSPAAHGPRAHPAPEPDRHPSPPGVDGRLDGGFAFLTEANGINDARQIVGEGATGTSGGALFWASPIHSPTVLSDGARGSVVAHGINNDGQIVGYVVSDPSFVALVWASPIASPTVLEKGSMIGSARRPSGSTTWVRSSAGAPRRTSG